MSSTTWLTTADAEAQYGFPAKTFAAWCREEKILGTQKAGGEWLMPRNGVAAFLKANPQLTPPDRNTAAQVPHWLWQALAVVALILGLIADIYAVPTSSAAVIAPCSGSSPRPQRRPVCFRSHRPAVQATSLVSLGWRKTRFHRVPRFRSRLPASFAGTAVVLMPAS